MVAQIAGCGEPVAELALQADVPLLERGRLEMQRCVDVDAERRERLRRPAVVQARERIAARIAEVRVREAAGGIGNRNLRAPRRVVGETGVEEEMRRVIEDAPGRSNARRSSPPSASTPPDARRKLRDLPKVVAARVALVARKTTPPARRVGAAADVLIDSAWSKWLTHPKCSRPAGTVPKPQARFATGSGAPPLSCT